MKCGANSRYEKRASVLSRKYPTIQPRSRQDLAADIRAEVLGSLRPLADRGVRQADFYVMRGTMGHMPSVLVEMGFVSNPAEESQMRKTSYQRKMAEAIFNGIRDFKHRYERQLTRN